eukprot:430738-Hanusia_phi.AAC.1
MIPYPHSRPLETLSRLQARLGRMIKCTGQYDLRSLSKEGVRPGTGGRGPFTTWLRFTAVLTDGGVRRVRAASPGRSSRRLGKLRLRSLLANQGQASTTVARGGRGPS